MASKNPKFNYEQAISNLLQSHLKSLDDLEIIKDDLTVEELISLGEVVENMEQD